MIELWNKNKVEICTSLFFIIALLIGLLLLSKTSKRNNKTFLVGVFLVSFIMVALNYLLFTRMKTGFDLVINEQLTLHFSRAVRIIIIDIAALSVSFLVLHLLSKEREKKKISTNYVAIIGVLISLASILMYFGIPVIPGYSFLKLEFSGLIIFLVFIWFDFKSAVIVSLITNLLHAILPGTSTPIILFLDELVNFIATMAFLLPSVIGIKRDENGKITNPKQVITYVTIGIFCTSVFMLFYNYLFNLPVIYHMKMSFVTVLSVFGLFNLIKWGSVGLLIIFLWQKLACVLNIKNN